MGTVQSKELLKLEESVRKEISRFYRLMIKLIHWLEQVNEWHFVWVSVILSEILTLIINTINSILWWGEISLDLLLIGTIDAFVVSLIVAGIVIFFIKRVKQLETNLTEPQLTEETLKDYAAKLAQSNDELAERNRQLLALQSAGATFTSTLDLEYVMNTVADEMISLLDVEGCALSEWNQADDTVTVIVEHGPDDWWSSGKPVKEVHHLQDYPLTKRALVERRVRQMTISQADIDPAELAYMQTAEITTLLLLPMIFHDQVIGLV